MSHPTFTVNERVLCYHGPLIYEAKVLKTETWDERNTHLGSVGAHYFVHYKGWKQTWDEWVPPQRILKFSETNIALQKKLSTAAQKTAPAAASKAAPSKEPGASTSAPGRGEGREGRARKEPRGHKRGRDEDESTRKPELKLTVPDILKMVLVDDWEAVTKNHQLVTLPRTPNVQELLQEFKEYVDALEKQPAHTEALPTIISGLQLYFDRSLGANLLYRFERVQYADIRKRYVTGPTVKVGEEKEMSAIYGSEHFMRMIVSLPTYIGGSNMDPETVSVIRDYVHELMTFMVKDRDRIFQREYETASSQYQHLSRT
ncbi:MRG-domain-containing protein [Gautieria morchelliformis]|nr:MRG-domain-containing protein [Gautieria morchelliformis]